MNWRSVAQYLLARTREPSIVHRGVQAVGGIIAAWALAGPERWIGLILSASALVGILMPDAVETAHATPPPALPPIDVPARPDAVVADADMGAVRTADRLRQPVPAGDRPVSYPSADPNAYPRFGSGFGDRD